LHGSISALPPIVANAIDPAGVRPYTNCYSSDARLDALASGQPSTMLARVVAESRVVTESRVAQCELARRSSARLVAAQRESVKGEKSSLSESFGLVRG